MREFFLCDLVKGNITNTDIIKVKLSLLELNIEEGSFCILSINIDNFTEKDSRLSEKEKQMMQISVKNIIGEVLEKYPGSIFFTMSTDTIVVVLSSGSGENSAIRDIRYRISEEIRFRVNKALNVNVTIGIGRVYGGFENIYISFNESRFATQYKLYEGKNSIIDIDDISPMEDKSFSFSREKEEHLVECLRLGDKQGASELLDGIFNEILKNRGLPVDYVQRVCLELLLSGSRCISELGGDFKEIFSENIISYKEISRYETMEDIKLWMNSIFEKIIDYIVEKRKSCKNKLVVNIQNYVSEHFSEDISLKSVADFFYINHEYLSRLFKRETGGNFVDYLLKVRMNKAMELIRDNKDIKAYEIAEKVGYKDPKYFSRVFKKYARKSLYSYKTELFD